MTYVDLTPDFTAARERLMTDMASVKTRRMPADWGIFEPGPNDPPAVGIDIEQEIIAALSAEIAAEIDRGILFTLRGGRYRLTLELDYADRTHRFPVEGVSVPAIEQAVRSRVPHLVGTGEPVTVAVHDLRAIGEEPVAVPEAFADDIEAAILRLLDRPLVVTARGCRLSAAYCEKLLTGEVA